MPLEEEMVKTYAPEYVPFANEPCPAEQRAVAEAQARLEAALHTTLMARGAGDAGLWGHATQVAAEAADRLNTALYHLHQAILGLPTDRLKW